MSSRLLPRHGEIERELLHGHGMLHLLTRVQFGHTGSSSQCSTVRGGLSSGAAPTKTKTQWNPVFICFQHLALSVCSERVEAAIEQAADPLYRQEVARSRGDATHRRVVLPYSMCFIISIVFPRFVCPQSWARRNLEPLAGASSLVDLHVRSLLG